MENTTTTNNPINENDITINQETLQRDVTYLIQQLYIGQIAKPGSKIEIIFEPKAKIQTIVNGNIEVKEISIKDL